MKIFTNNKVYVQNNDLAYFMHFTEGVSIPSSIFNRVFGNVFIVTDQNRYEFQEFSLPEEIEFFKNCDWMVDYNSFNGMNDEEIVQCGVQINDERNRIAAAFNELPEKEREQQYNKVSTQLEMLEFKMWSVRDVLWHKQGHLTFPLPLGTNVEFLDSSNQTYEKENIIKKALRKFKRK